MPSSPALYLASQSPRRLELLRQIGVDVEVVKISVPEQRQIAEAPEVYAERLAREKSVAGASAATPLDRPVLGADTIVLLGEQVFEKPNNRLEAIEWLRQLSGKTHQVITAVAVTYRAQTLSVVNLTSVRFRPIAVDEAERYWLSGEPVDKAGGYAIQGLGAVFVERIEGSYSAVVGLPLRETAELLAKFNIPIWQH
ncbi:MAG: septum formation protein [Cellvibrionaceae bacterium]|jgi:septum formation protein